MRLNFDEMSNEQKQKWWDVAEGFAISKKPPAEMNDREIEACLWYWDCLDTWDYEAPQSYSEELMRLEERLSIAELKFEQARRYVQRAKSNRDEWVARRKA